MSNGYMLHCDINWCNVLTKRRDVVGYRFLTSIPIRKQSMLITYTIEIKKANVQNGFALIEKRYHKYFRPLIFTFS